MIRLPHSEIEISEIRTPSGLFATLLWLGDDDAMLYRFRAGDGGWRASYDQPEKGRSTARVVEGALAMRWGDVSVELAAGEHTYDHTEADAPPGTTVGYEAAPGTVWHCWTHGLILPSRSRQTFHVEPGDLAVPAGAVLAHIDGDVAKVWRAPEASSFAFHAGLAWLVAPR